MEYYRLFFDDMASIERYDIITNVLAELEYRVPEHAEAYDLLAYGYYKAKKYIQAAEIGQKALDIADNGMKQSIRFNLAKIYQYANQPEKAVRLLAINIMANPDDYDSIIDYSVALYSQGNKGIAGLKLQSLLERPDLDEENRKVVEFNLGSHYLREGEFKQGMKNLLIGRELRIWGSHTHNFPIPKWDGVAQEGKRILVIGEGGIGDEFINMRFGKHLRDRGMIPSWASAHGLADISERLGYEQNIYYKNFTSDIPNIRDFDYWVPAMDIPALLDIDDNELWYGPYLTPEESYLKPIPRDVLNIGIRWSGNPLYEQDLHRTIPIEDIIKVIEETVKVPYRLYSFQKEGGEEVYKSHPEIVSNLPMHHFGQTLVHLSQMDLVISSCTSVGHAAGGLGVPTILFTPIMCYYTWANEKEKTPWYGDNFTVLHQVKPRSWVEPINRLREILNQLNSR